MTQTPNLADLPVDPADIGRLLAWGQGLLNQQSESARLEAQLLLAHVLGRPRSYVSAHPEESLAPEAVGRYRDLVERRVQGEPIAHLTGEREFWSLPLRVSADVLVPRPETELAVERCLALCGPQSAQVLDLGTGSGAIALALATERSAWQILATDRSRPALQVARANAARLGLNSIRFVQGDWFEPLAADPSRRRFHLIVSNPPYIAAGDPHLAALRFEPALALTPGVTGMEALEAIWRQAPVHLLPGGWLVLEHGADQGQKLRGALVAAGYARVRSHVDLAGYDRVTEAQWPLVFRGT